MASFLITQQLILINPFDSPPRRLLSIRDSTRTYPLPIHTLHSPLSLLTRSPSHSQNQDVLRVWASWLTCGRGRSFKPQRKASDSFTVLPESAQTTMKPRVQDVENTGYGLQPRTPSFISSRPSMGAGMDMDAPPRPTREGESRFSAMTGMGEPPVTIVPPKSFLPGTYGKPRSFPSFS